MDQSKEFNTGLINHIVDILSNNISFKYFMIREFKEDLLRILKSSGFDHPQTDDCAVFYNILIYNLYNTHRNILEFMVTSIGYIFNPYPYEQYLAVSQMMDNIFYELSMEYCVSDTCYSISSGDSITA